MNIKQWIEAYDFGDFLPNTPQTHKKCGFFTDYTGSTKELREIERFAKFFKKLKDNCIFDLYNTSVEFRDRQLVFRNEKGYISYILFYDCPALGHKYILCSRSYDKPIFKCNIVSQLTKFMNGS